MTTTPEAKDKLDAATIVAANGPRDETLDWHQIDWRAVEESVRRLRQRIFAASQAGHLKRVRNLQKLMLRSRVNTLLSVRRVTERNAGRSTAGVDGEVALAPRGQGGLGPQRAAQCRAVQGPAGQAGTHPEEGQRWEAAPARHSGDR